MMVVVYQTKHGKIERVTIGKGEYVKVSRTIKHHGGKVLRSHLA
jgi:hypothetical protein